MSSPRGALGLATDRWVAFWDRREAPASLALTRILVGLVVFADLAAAKMAGAVPDLWAPPPWGMASGFADGPPRILSRWLGASPETALLVWAFAIVSSLLFAAGAFHRTNGWILAALLAELAHIQPDGDGFDRLTRIAVPILAFSRASACWSLDTWIARKRGQTPPKEVPAWPRYLVMLQLAWMYFSAAHTRDDPAWWPPGGFAAIGQVLADPHFARFPPGSLAWAYPLTQLGTVATMLFELSAPFVLFVPAWLEDGDGRWAHRARTIRWIWLALGVMLHLGIVLTMQLGAFPFGMLALYPALVHPDDLRKAAASVPWRPLLDKV